MDNERIASNYKMVRLLRTQSSEVYLIWDDDRRLGQIDLHYAQDTIHGTLILEADLNVEEEEALIAQIDDDLVHSYLPAFDREDFFVTVYRGEEVSTYTDTSGGMEGMDEEDE